MRIAFSVVKNLTYGGGIERYTLEVGSRLARRGHDVRVYSMTHYGEVAPRVGGMRVTAVPAVPLRPMEKLSAGAFAAARALLDDPCDIVHFQHVGAGWAAWLPKLRGRRCVLQLHGVAWRSPHWGRVGSMFLRALEGLAVRQCDVVTGTSLAQNRYYARAYGVRVPYIPSGADVKQPVEARRILSLGLAPRSYVLYAGRLSEEKGVHYLLSAFRRLDTDCKLVLAGPACDRDYWSRLQESAAADPRIVFTGQVRGRLLDELFSNALVYAQPSQLEGLSLSLLEAMGYGSCCLVSDLPENLEAIGQAGWHFRTGDVDNLTERLGWLLRHPDRALATGPPARQRVRQHYTWDHVTDLLEELYTDLLRGGRKAA